MSKTLILGHFNEGSSWTEMAEEYALALSSCSDVVCRSIIVNGGYSISNRVSNLFAKSIEDVDTVLQIVLPQYMEYTGDLTCIAFSLTESDSNLYTGSSQVLGLMDAVITPNNVEEILNFYQYVVPIPTDITKFDKVLPTPNIDDAQYKYKFYFIGEFNKRKRLSSLLRAYHKEFNKNDNTALIIKASRGGESPDNLSKMIQDVNDSIKQGLRAHSEELYQGIGLITNRLSEDQMLGLHKYCDCFVSTSNGEAYQIPAFEAKCFGNHVIAPNIRGPKDYVTDLVDTVEDACFNAEEYTQDLHSAHENWSTLSTTQLSKAMREAYEQNKGQENPDLNTFSYNTLGRNLKEIIDEVRGHKIERYTLAEPEVES